MDIKFKGGQVKLGGEYIPYYMDVVGPLDLAYLITSIDLRSRSNPTWNLTKYFLSIGYLAEQVGPTAVMPLSAYYRLHNTSPRDC